MTEPLVEKRTPGGLVLRNSLDEEFAKLGPIPPGKKWVAFAAVSKEGVELGAVKLTSRGWLIETSVKVAAKEGRVTGVIRVTG